MMEERGQIDQKDATKLIELKETCLNSLNRIDSQFFKLMPGIESGDELL